MDREPDEMRSLGVLGICKDAYSILYRHLRFFLSLSATLVLPLGVLIFCHGFVVDPLLKKISRNEGEVFEEEIAGAPVSAQTRSNLDAEKFWLMILTFIYYVFVIAFSLLSTAAIVYTVASIYTAKGLSYVKVLSVVPKVWKRLFMTFLWAHVLLFLYNFAFIVLVVFLIFLDYETGWGFGYLAFPLVIVFLCLSVYIYLVWHLASVVSVLEDSYGVAALRKSSELIKGKRWVACSVFLIYAIFTSLVLSTYNVYVRDSTQMQSVFARLIIGVLHLLLWTAFTVIGIVVQTVVYFVCKSFHQESIDKYALSAHLEGYLGEYMPLKGPVSLDSFDDSPKGQP